MITREQLVDVEDRRKLIDLSVAGVCALAIIYIAYRVVLVLAGAS